jgi:hypothetical protein
MKASATKTKPEKEKKKPHKNEKLQPTKCSFTNAVRSCWELEQ